MSINRYMNYPSNNTIVVFISIFIISILSRCVTNEDTKNVSSAPIKDKSIAFDIRMTLEHDPEAFTQGLVFNGDKVLESTGRKGSSWISEFDIASSTYSKKVNLDSRYFGEGITLLNGKVYQLTWKSKRGFVYDVNTFEKLDEFSYDFEGWGITHDNKHLIISDGTNMLHYFDTLSLTEMYSNPVLDYNRKVSKLNELEFIEGYIYANQWESDIILKIDTASFAVANKIDLGYIVKEIKRIKPDADVLNGIAYNPKTKDVLITGKLWPRSYLTRLNE